MSAQEKAKLAALEKKRKEMLEGFAAQKQELAAETAKNRTGSDRFTSKTDGVDEALKKSTYGLVQLSDFRETREKLEEQARREAAGTSEVKADDKKKKKKKKETKVKLSFDDGDEEQEEVDSRASSKKPTNGGGSAEGTEDEDRPTKRAKLGKNPSVDTHFLPDREREEAERMERDQLRREWLQKQEDMKMEDIEITYSYWDGTGHRKVVTCKKGDSIAQFLEKCRQQFPELRAVSVDNLMYIKEDLIVPHHYTFYDFIVNKYRGKSGPMFSFDVHDDVRLIHDASVEKDETHAGKVVERSWYNRSKHIFPASRWEVFNPEVNRTRYTVHGE
ncbi:XAP5, circadian clock regulator-domain-containing protein [Leucosporidium creatinivorum]|uniref:XAP5, circadian clock regulator-domain-containing protein n=1 Tax=Leucosporidium creatinivorum TaxID=106004 RepID=A0A1Y2G1Z2_9BASI|nr:XAP5, circadian clock regulator-domain-containing protein [Leucosporidium creatinivorum]